MKGKTRLLLISKGSDEQQSVALRQSRQVILSARSKTPQGFHLVNGSYVLASSDLLLYQNMLYEKDYLPVGSYSQVTITETAGQWFVSVKAAPKRPLGVPVGRVAGSVAGVDLGVNSFVTLGSGEKID